ncbi:hypothetical protein [Ruminococcus sp.]|uniref:hypothetical protein n=1 Tax=Ruminococcus sp. TaxID=41978 RepID=UPI001B7AAC60|nr:hypothetical protein [Ruminococcus sp.]MBP5433760.1 hypothetical protein [Ruminococcus sp.]
MLTIQQAGSEILGDRPGKFYVFAGTEYGVKRKYIEHLKNFYKHSVTADTVSEVIESMQKKSLLPVPPKLYIVRYDESFVSSLGDKSRQQIEKTKINGTLICLYETEKAAVKCAKYLPDCTVSFDAVHTEYVKKYLRADFPGLADSIIAEAVRIHREYIGAYNICSVMNCVSEDEREHISVKDMDEMFGYSLLTGDEQFRQAFAAKDIRMCVSMLDNYEDSFDSVFYLMLASLLELEKLITNPKQKSDYRAYIKGWTAESVYNMFIQVYSELEQSRELQGYNIRDRLLYLLLLLQYGTIPQMGVMHSGI